MEFYRKFNNKLGEEIVHLELEELKNAKKMISICYLKIVIQSQER